MDLIHPKEVLTACGGKVVPKSNDSQSYSLYGERIIYFCEDKCRVEFEDDPTKFINSHHFLIEFETMESIESRRRENLDPEVITEIEEFRSSIADATDTPLEGSCCH